MKTTTVAVMILALLTCFVTIDPVRAEPTGSTTMGGGNTPSPENVPHDTRTDLTGGQSGVPDEYSTTPVRQGKLKEVTDSKWLNHPVVNQQGEDVGKITKVLKDEKTQDIEYVMFQLNDVKSARPLPWSKFREKGDQLVLTMKKEELQPALSQKDVKDMSPDLAMFMDEIEQKREEPKGAGSMRPPGEPQSFSGASTLGEDQAASRPAVPPPSAPGFEKEGAKGQK